MSGGEVGLRDMINLLYKVCGSQIKGFFSQLLLNLKFSDIYFTASEDELTYVPKPQRERVFVCIKIFTLISFSRIDLKLMSMKSESQEMQMDLIMNLLEEELENKFKKSEMNVFKKEFENYYLVSLPILDGKIK
jgi:hypothetical protein